jgi:NAD(P)-dependent dehydrogenase (short-subunit alcohol dehydrogenase family)
MSWMASLAPEVAAFGITTTVLNPGFVRTELLTEQSTNYAEPSIADYDERRARQLEVWRTHNAAFHFRRTIMASRSLPSGPNFSSYSILWRTIVAPPSLTSV